MQKQKIELKKKWEGPSIVVKINKKVILDSKKNNKK